LETWKVDPEAGAVDVPALHTNLAVLKAREGPDLAPKDVDVDARTFKSLKHGW
jgi:hypothetical protein